MAASNGLTQCRARLSAAAERLEDRRVLNAGDLEPTYSGDGKPPIALATSKFFVVDWT